MEGQQKQEEDTAEFSTLQQLESNDNESTQKADVVPDEMDHVLIDLIPLGNTEKWKRIRLLKGNTITFGRGKNISAETLVNDGRISNIHTKIFEENGQIICEDCSTNGTFVNEQKIGKNNRIALQDKDILGIVVPSATSKLVNELPCYMITFVDKSLSTQKDWKRSRDVFESNTEETQKEELEPETKKQKKELDEKTKSLLSKFGMTDSQLEESQEDPMEKELTCTICSDIFYKPASVVPCLHNFCASCISNWIKREDTCPQCRVPMREIRKNHQLNNLVDIFVKAHPSRDRSKEEKEQLDEQSILKNNKDSHSIREDRNDNSSEEEQEEDDNEEEDDEEDDDDNIGTDGNRDFIFNRQAIFIPHPMQNQTGYHNCRNCQQPNQLLDGFTCGINQTHVSCTACRGLMPLRTDLDPAIKPQNCRFCNHYFCEQYYGTCNVNSNFVRLNQHTMNILPMDCLSRNTIERQILDEYLTSHNVSVNQCWTTILNRIASNQYQLTERGRQVHETDFTCAACASSIFSKLLYDYRKDISNSDLPSWAATRSNCWYGKDCRTQQHNIPHARKLNHICDNVRANGGSSSSNVSGSSSANQSSVASSQNANH